MKNIDKNLLFFFIPFLLLVAVSCGDDEEVSSYLQLKPTITEISVTEGLRGTEVILTGVNFEDVTEVKFGNVDAEFTKTATTITSKVPNEVEVGELNIAVYSPNGSDRMLFRAVVEPTIIEVSPLKALPGSEITITGEELNWVNEVLIGGASVDFTATQNTIVFTIPFSSVLGETNIVVRTGGGSDEVTITILDQPVINSVSSMSGEADKEITIEGINFVDVESVKIGETETEFEVDGPTSLTFRVPKVASTGIVTVITATGTVSTEEDFTIIVVTEVPRIVVFEEKFIDVWENGGWGSVRDYANQEQPLNGNYAIKVNYQGTWGGVQIYPKPSAFDLTGYKTITLSIYGDPATGGDVQLYIKGSDGVTSKSKALDVVPGEYRTFIIPLSDLENPSDISELVLQDVGTENNLIYVDAVVLK